MLSGLLIGMHNLPVPVFGTVMLTVMLLAAAAGQALRIWKIKLPLSKTEESGESVAQEGYLLGGVLGLLGLLMAFSFGMVIERHETRRDLAVAEANAIGTAYLRAQFLDEPYRTALSNLLVEYTDNKVKLATVKGDNTAYLAKNGRLQTEIWAQARAARESALSHGMTTVLLNSFNEVIDLDAELRLARELRLPPSVVYLLLSYLIITAAVAGYQIDGPRGRRAALILFMMIALSLAFIANINRPMNGNERDSQRPMILLLESLREQPPQVFDRAAPDGEGVPR